MGGAQKFELLGFDVHFEAPTLRPRISAYGTRAFVGLAATWALFLEYFHARGSID
jgi:hypothetical protein